MGQLGYECNITEVETGIRIDIWTPGLARDVAEQLDGIFPTYTEGTWNEVQDEINGYSTQYREIGKEILGDGSNVYVMLANDEDETHEKVLYGCKNGECIYDVFANYNWLDNPDETVPVG